MAMGQVIAARNSAGDLYHQHHQIVVLLAVQGAERRAFPNDVSNLTCCTGAAECAQERGWLVLDWGGEGHPESVRDHGRRLGLA